MLFFSELETKRRTGSTHESSECLIRVQRTSCVTVYVLKSGRAHVVQGRIFKQKTHSMDEDEFCKSGKKVIVRSSFIFAKETWLHPSLDLGKRRAEAVMGKKRRRANVGVFILLRVR